MSTGSVWMIGFSYFVFSGMYKIPAPAYQWESVFYYVESKPQRGKTNDEAWSNRLG